MSEGPRSARRRKPADSGGSQQQQQVAPPLASRKFSASDAAFVPLGGASSAVPIVAPRAGMSISSAASNSGESNASAALRVSKAALSSSSSSTPALRATQPQPLASSPNAAAADGGAEDNLQRMHQRQKQLLFGKATTAYTNYLCEVPPSRRDDGEKHPVTPRIDVQNTKRQFDAAVRAWRRSLHCWDDEGTADNTADESERGSVATTTQRQPASRAGQRNAGASRLNGCHPLAVHQYRSVIRRAAQQLQGLVRSQFPSNATPVGSSASIPAANNDSFVSTPPQSMASLPAMSTSLNSDAMSLLGGASSAGSNNGDGGDASAQLVASWLHGYNELIEQAETVLFSSEQGSTADGAVPSSAFSMCSDQQSSVAGSDSACAPPHISTTASSSQASSSQNGVQIGARGAGRKNAVRVVKASAKRSGALDDEDEDIADDSSNREPAPVQPRQQQQQPQQHQLYSSRSNSHENRASSSDLLAGGSARRTAFAAQGAAAEHDEDLFARLGVGEHRPLNLASLASRDTPSNVLLAMCERNLPQLQFTGAGLISSRGASPLSLHQVQQQLHAPRVQISPLDSTRQWLVEQSNSRPTSAAGQYDHPN